jgi:hypothetical protein
MIHAPYDMLPKKASLVTAAMLGQLEAYFDAAGKFLAARIKDGRIGL